MSINWGLLNQGQPQGGGIMGGLAQGLQLVNQMDAMKMRREQLEQDKLMGQSTMDFRALQMDAMRQQMEQQEAAAAQAQMQAEAQAQKMAMVQHLRKNGTIEVSSALKSSMGKADKGGFSRAVNNAFSKAVARGDRLTLEYLAPVRRYMEAGDFDNAMNLYKTQQMMTDPEMYTKTFGKESVEQGLKKGQAAKFNAEAEQIRAQTDQLPQEMQAKLAELEMKKAEAGELPTDVRKVVNDSSDKALVSYKLASDSDQLVNDIGSFIKNAGLTGKTLSFLRKQAGWQNMEDLIRAKYTEIRNKGLINNLPPGVASETDIQLIKAGYLDENASPETLQSFVKTMAIAERYEGARQEAKSEWVSQNKTAGKSKKDMNVMGIDVPKGMSYIDFVQKYGAELSETQMIEGGGKSSQDDLNIGPESMGLTPIGPGGAPVTQGGGMMPMTSEQADAILNF